MPSRATWSRAAPPALLAGTYFALAVWYGLAAPLNEPYDERYHFAYVLSIALDGGLPIQDVEHPGPWGNEGSQPPLFYVLAAAVSAWTADRDTSRLIERNPYTVRHNPLYGFDDNRNIYVHRSDQDPPYERNVLAMHLARIVSALCGAGAVLATYMTAQSLAPGNRALAAGAAAFHAFIPSFIYSGAAVNNDALAVCLASVTLWGVVKTAKSREWSNGGAARLGVVSGLAALAKLSALPLLGIAGLAVLMRGGRRELSKTARLALALLAGFLAVAGWWFARNLALYSELLGTQTMNRIAGLRAVPAGVDQVLAELPQVERTFWAAFGTGNVHPDEAFLLAPRLIVAAGAAGCLRALWSARAGLRTPSQQATCVILLGAWVGMFTGVFIWWLITVTAVTGRLLFPLLTPVCIAIVFGVGAIAPERGRAWAQAAPGALMMTLAVSMPSQVIGPAYARPQAVTVAEIPAGAPSSGVIYGELFRLVATGVRGSEAVTATALPVELYWQALTAPQGDYSVYLRLIGSDGIVLGGRDSLPGRGNFPTTDWLPGVVYRDRLSLYLEAPVMEPVVADVSVGLYETTSQRGLPARNPDGTRLGRVTIGRVLVVPSEAPVYQPTQVLKAEFSGGVELAGYDRTAEGFALYWRARQALADDYTVFLQALDRTGKVIAQSDSQPRGGAYPTSFWRAGDVVRDPHRMTMPAGVTRVIAGMYLLRTGERLKSMSGSDDFAVLETYP